jgi:type VI secretion system protein ImpK
MHPSDPFSSHRDDDKTIVRPSPGGRKRRTSVMPPASANFPGGLHADAGGDFQAGDNPFIARAFSLLSIVPKLRNLPFHHAVDELRDQLAGEIRQFQDRSLSQGCLQEQVKLASYFLCTLIDETVLNTPWGNQSSWGHQSLLITFHGEARGGERFFQLLDRLQPQAARNLDLLELAYLCLSLGFEGKYRLAASGMRDLDQLRQGLYLLIQRAKGEDELPLSANWQGLRNSNTPMERHVPIWVAAVVTGAILMAIYMGFAYAVNSASNLTYQQLATFAREGPRSAPAVAQHPAVSPASTAKPVRTIRFESMLSAEIQRGMVEIVDGNILRVSNAFPSGSDQIKKDYIPMLSKIARELQSDTRLIMVIGHTDNRQIFSARFPSNWHLSQARAKNVVTIMTASASLDGRIRFEGHAASEPIVPNDTAANRARNRRIDIHIR